MLTGNKTSVLLVAITMIVVISLPSLQHPFILFRDKNAEELEAYYKKKFAESSDRLVCRIFFMKSITHVLISHTD